MSAPVSSPWAPAMGCRVKAAMPVISHRQRSVSYMTSRQPADMSPPPGSWGVSGCRRAKPGRAATSSVNLGLYFMVHDPNG